MYKKLRDVWPIKHVADYKMHFAIHNGREEPREAFVRDRAEWKGWQEYQRIRYPFNRPYIFSLMRLDFERNLWLFGGVFRVLAPDESGNRVELMSERADLVGRLILVSGYRGRMKRGLLFEKHYDSLEVAGILREPFYGQAVSGIISWLSSFATD